MMNRLTPFLLAMLGVLAGCILDAVAKHLTGSISVLSITAGRYAGAAIISVGILIAFKRGIPSWESARFHTIRGGVQLLGTVTFFWGLDMLGLAEATILGFTATLMLGPLAWVFLGERLQLRVALVTLFGFFGAALAVTGKTIGGPEDGNRLLGVVSILVAASCYAVALILLRFRTGKEDPVTIVAMANIMPLVFIIPTMSLTQTVLPFSYWGYFILLGFLGLMIWGSFTLAYSKTEAQYIAPVEYTALIWSALFGMLLFGEWPSWHLYAGGFIIIVACLSIVLRRVKPVNRRTAV